MCLRLVVLAALLAALTLPRGSDRANVPTCREGRVSRGAQGRASSGHDVR